MNNIEDLKNTVDLLKEENDSLLIENQNLKSEIFDNEKRLFKLTCLEKFGVDEWDNYETAMIDYKLTYDMEVINELFDSQTNN